MSKTFTLHVPISKVDEEQRMVYGVATTEDVDSQNDIVDYGASKKAFSEWLGNIREMHEPKAVGKRIETEYDDKNKQVIIGAKISESADGENAWIKIQEGVLTGFSIGGKVHKISTEKVKVDGEEVSATRIIDYDLSEVSLVDNPANANAKFLMVKSVDGGLQRVEEEVKVSGETAKGLIRMPAWYGQFMLPMEKAQKLYDESSMQKKDYSDKQRQAMADSGEAMPDGSFLIKTKADLKNAIQSYGRSKQKDAVKQHIIRRAKALGATDLLPEEWNVKAQVSEDLKKSVCDASWLASLAASLVAYIKSEAQEGDAADEGQITELKSALGVIQEAIAAEVTEGDDFEPSDQLYDYVMMAQEATNLKKGNDMANVEKTNVIGGEERDENANPTAPAEPATEPAAAEPAAPAAEEKQDQPKEEPKAAEPAPAPEKPAEEPAAPEAPAEPAKPAEPAAPADNPAGKEGLDPKAAPAEEPANPEAPAEDAGKSVTVGDLRKFTDSLLAKLGDSNKEQLTKTLGEFSDKVDEKFAGLEGRISKLEDQPAASKVKASYVDVEKGKESSTVEESEVAALVKRRDELAANPQLGTPNERMELSSKLRKAQAAGFDLEKISAEA